MKKTSFIVVVIWLSAVGAAFFSNFASLKNGHNYLAFQTARAFFRQIVVDRAWNSKHGGVYVPVTEETQPNPYLNDPLRDLETNAGISLTKINPAFMTRQIAEIAAKENGAHFHITSLNPIRPDNKPTKWEAEWLETFEKGSIEQGTFVRDGQNIMFRYMAPLITKSSCLKCHAKHGYKEGEIRGGISVTLPFFPQPDYLPLILGYGTAALLGALIICLASLLLDKSRYKLLHTNELLSEEIKVRKTAQDEQKKLIASLQSALTEIKILRGIIPICSGCKQIRDDKGAWSQIESYISSHSEAEFSHGLCPTCYEKQKKEIEAYHSHTKKK